MTLPSLDMPHWARFAVQAARDNHNGLPHLLNSEIYATLQAGGFNVAASEARLADADHRRELAAWRNRDEALRAEVRDDQ